MSLAHKIAALSSSLAHHQAQYTQVRARRAALTPYATPADVVAALDAASSQPPAERYALVAVLVAEHQEGTSALWGSLLTVAFAPMLLRYRKQLGKPEDEDRDQHVLLAFLLSIGHVRVESAGVYATVAIQRGTKKALVAHQVEEASEPVFVSFDENVHTPCAPDGMAMAEILAEAAWAERREARLLAARRASRKATVHALPVSRRRTAA